MTDATALHRQVLAIGGPDREDFLQGLVTNDVSRIATGPLYAALLSPKGKYLADFFLVPDGERILLDVAADQAPDLLKRLSMYRLRSKVTIEPTGLSVSRSTGPAPAGSFVDPRHPALGWRLLSDGPAQADGTDWDALRVTHAIPEAGIELITDDSYILEMGFERLNGVDFRKGCYVGQEVTARMKHKTELRKGLARVAVEGDAETGAAILCEGKPVGTLHTRAGNEALAYLRFDRAGAEMVAGDASLRLLPQ